MPQCCSPKSTPSFPAANFSAGLLPPHGVSLICSTLFRLPHFLELSLLSTKLGADGEEQKLSKLGSVVTVAQCAVAAGRDAIFDKFRAGSPLPPSPDTCRVQFSSSPHSAQRIWTRPNDICCRIFTKLVGICLQNLILTDVIAHFCKTRSQI